MKPAILRTYASETNILDVMVEVEDEHDFTDSYADTVPFSVGSNQSILDPDDCAPRCSKGHEIATF